MTERMSGSDALLWHLERDDLFTHTLKTVVLDVAGFGRSLTLDDLRSAFQTHGGHIPHLVRKPQAPRGMPARPFWVTDPDFDIDRHLDEVVVAPPGDRAALDDLHGRLASTALPPDRPQWAATLVHGLEHGRQAVVFRLHHAVADGGAALNSFMAVTSSDGSPPARCPANVDDRPVSDSELRWEALREVPRLVAGLGAAAVRSARDVPRLRRLRRAHPSVPGLMSAERKYLSHAEGSDRVCASSSTPFAPYRQIADRFDVTVNGVYHAVIAGALRTEFIEHGDAPDGGVAAFGIATGQGADGRTRGNFVSPAIVSLATGVDDPIERLRRTAESCREAVALKREVGLDRADQWAAYTCRVAPWLQSKTHERTRNVYNHVTTANVRGPETKRRIGSIVVDEWISFALAMNPSNVNVTAYSYDGRMSLGLVAAPEAMPDPARFLERMNDELAILEAAAPS